MILWRNVLRNEFALKIPVSEEETPVCAKGTMTTGIMFEQRPIEKMHQKPIDLEE
jgi:hypothetical protein